MNRGIEQDGTPSASGWEHAPSFAPLAARYDGFIFDVWGTLYGGGPVFEGARVVLERLASAGKPVVILSNAPRPPEVVAKRLDPLGIPADLYRAIVTSGGETRRALVERSDPVFAALGPRCVNLGGASFQDLLPGTGFEEVAEVAAADWIFNPGPLGGLDPVEAYRDQLSEALARDMIMICANPDVHVIDKGVRKICAGAVAALFESMGGRVAYHGKPHRPIFERSVEALGLGWEDRGRVLVVGDNRATDIKGAEAAGLESLLLADGIDADRLLDESGGLDAARLRAFADAPGATPTWLATRLTW